MSKQQRMKKLNWININTRKPEINQQCLTKMKHGIIEGTFGIYNGEEGFYGYYWRDIEWYATDWLPIEQAE